MSFIISPHFEVEVFPNFDFSDIRQLFPCSDEEKSKSF